MEFKRLGLVEQEKLQFISLLEDDIISNFFKKLGNYNLIYKGDIQSTIQHFGLIAYNILLSVLDNDQLFSLFSVPNSQHRWILINKDGVIIRKSKQTFDSILECERKGKWILALYPDFEILVE